MERNEMPAVGRRRWLVALLVGAALWLGATVLSQVVPTVMLGLDLSGVAFAWVAGIQLLLGPLAVLAGLRIAKRRLRDVGLVRREWLADASIGMGVAIAFAALQFLLIIPATGGAQRSDIIVNTAQIGGTLPGLFAIIALAWAGSLSEELFFRGLLLNGLQRIFGGGRVATTAAGLVVILVFASLHGYQGWAGMVDTGLYGGLAMTLLYLWRDRRLTACIVAHAGWNTIAACTIYAAYA